MNNLVMLYVNEIMKGNFKNINEIPKLYRKKVQAKCEELGIEIDEEGNFVVPSDLQKGTAEETI